MAVMISPHGCFQVVPWLNADAGGCVVRSALGAGHQRWAKSTSQVFTCHNTTQTRTKEREGATRLGNGVSNDSESQSAGGEKFQTSSATRALALRPRRARTVRFMLTGTSAAHVPQDAGFLLGRDASLTVFLNSVWHGGLQCACASCVELNFHTHTACSRTPRMPSLRCAGRASMGSGASCCEISSSTPLSGAEPRRFGERRFSPDIEQANREHQRLRRVRRETTRRLMSIRQNRLYGMR